MTTGEWQELYDRDARATPFTSPGWILPWWRDPAREATPLTAEVRDHDGRLAGLAPMAIRRRGPLRILFGAGSDVGNYWDVLAEEGDRERVTRQIACEIVRRSAEWDLLVLNRTEPDSALFRALADEGLPMRTRRREAFPCLTLPAGLDEYIATLPSRQRTYVRKAHRMLDAGDLELRRPTDPAQVSDAVAHWHQLRTRWWRERGRDMNADHAREGFGRYATEVMQDLVPRGGAEVLELHRDGRRVGVHLNLLGEQTVYWWLGGFAPEVAQLGPGRIVLAAAIRDAIDRGRPRMDFMLGREPYKYSWGAVDRWLPLVVIGSGRRRSALLVDALRARDTLAARRARSAEREAEEPR